MFQQSCHEMLVQTSMLMLQRILFRHAATCQGALAFPERGSVSHGQSVLLLLLVHPQLARTQPFCGCTYLFPCHGQEHPTLLVPHHAAYIRPSFDEGNEHCIASQGAKPAWQSPNVCRPCRCVCFVDRACAAAVCRRGCVNLGMAATGSWQPRCICRGQQQCGTRLGASLQQPRVRSRAIRCRPCAQDQMHSRRAQVRYSDPTHVIC